MSAVAYSHYAANAKMPRRDKATLASIVIAHLHLGWTYSQVAEAFGVSRCTVAGIVYRAKQRQRDA